MSRDQRNKSVERSELRVSVDAFIANPCRLSAQQTRDLLAELCVDLGYCLSPSDAQTLETDPPTDPESFAQLVVKLEGLEPSVAHVAPVLERVVRTFERVARLQSQPR